MTRIKLCGLMCPEDIRCANELMPDLVGFVFWEKSRRYVDGKTAKELRSLLDPAIKSVGVFVDEDAEYVAELIEEGIIDIAQLHGSEDEDYIKKLRALLPAMHTQDTNGIGFKNGTSDIRIIKAFKIRAVEDVTFAGRSSADMILTDAGMGEGRSFDWDMLSGIKRPYFLAGGLDCKNVVDALRRLEPYGVDVSSGIETDGQKDHEKMRDFVTLVRSTDVSKERKTKWNI